MADFSIGDAAFAGFRLVGRKPSVIFGWGLLIFVCLGIPLALMMSSIIPFAMMVATEAAQTAAQTGGAKPVGGHGAGPPPEFWAAYTRMMAAQPLLLIGGLALRAVLSSAVIRAVLAPDQSSWFYMRVGIRELWVLLVTFVVGLIIGFGAMFAVIPVAIVLSVFAAMHQYIVAGVIGGVLLLAFIVGVIYVSLRLFMAVPMSWDRNEFRLFESWAFTKGHVGKMFMVVLIQIGIVIIFELIMALIVALVVFSVFRTTGFGEGQLRAMLTNQGAGVSLVACAALAGLVFCFIGAFMQAVLYAPWVEVYRQLRDSAPPPPPYAHAPGEAPIAPPA